ncbi:sushi, von Willebrand factor type A, EGF and pentraxin domain-containing protein 1-like [Myxocyprinus asiaticus]|uniref:sushi, von Willebrand factor type A, EGF and pentraxin domain-containing protein 1-like n=1 Tax=Myxocyprinus asiaticus TaxID=70543 RepID=UPI00222241D3|nr:sushi, von Willebrand factor type A, EGF and pentraxin domain-containing protein 1-like [Myxocyprinus asiaticus]
MAGGVQGAYLSVWAPRAATVVKCLVIDVANGQVAPKGDVFNTVVQITCSPGFKLNGAQQLRCEDGSWTPNVPTCEPVKCPAIDGQVAPKEVVFDTVVQITCSPGYKLNGPQQLRCGADGSWTPGVPTCEPVVQTNKQCGEPRKYPDKLLDNKYLLALVFRHGDKIVYKCAPGHMQAGGSPISFCMDGQWTALNLKCSPHAADISVTGSSVKCPIIDVPHGFVVNAKGSLREAVSNSVVRITCSPGFRLNGASQLRCGADGSWTPSVPTCSPHAADISVAGSAVKCPVIDVPHGFVVNAKGSLREAVLNTVVRITCSPGFRLNGASQLRCGADGSWTPNVPTCEPGSPHPADISVAGSAVKCPIIDVPHGFVVNAKGSLREAVLNTVVRITCSPGFRLNGASQLRCGADGSWTPNVPTCKPVTCPIIDVANGLVLYAKGSPRGTVFNTVQITCSPGFRLNGASQLRCGTDGSWTPSVPTCEPVKCPVINITNGVVMTNTKGSLHEAVFDTIVQITCSPGFRLNGASQLRCGADGSWTPNVPTCKLGSPHAADISVSGSSVKCPIIDVPHGFVVNAKGSPLEAVNTVVQITCSPGFSLNGTAQLRCGADGSWTPSVPTCEPVQCPVINITNGVVMTNTKGSPLEAVFDTTVQITCSPGYKLNGTQQLRCGADGSWTPSVPTCEQVTCSTPVVANGVLTNGESPSYKPKDTVIFMCREGFDMTGSPYVTCGLDGQWQDLPRCLNQMQKP